MNQPKWFIMESKEKLMCRLKKSLYGLKRSPTIWYQNIDMYVLGLNFDISQANHCIYTKQIGNKFVIVTLYVDGMLLVINTMGMIKIVKY